MEQIKGKYLLERPLGRGGMAEVFLGRKIGAAGFSRPVAIKRILAGRSADAQFQAMFIAEARLSSRLSHGNVVSVLDFDEDETGRLFLVMELVDGTDLDGLLRTGLLPLPVVLFVTKEILRGLGHAHDLPVSDDEVRGLVHRDVSPQNVLISWDGAVKVSDFGIAKARAATNASASMLLKGKAAYMSPEQANGAVLDGRSDLFAVGVMLWEMLCGASLFGRDSIQATLKGVLFDPIPSPRSRRPSVPEDIERVTMRLLEKDREDRYRNAEAVIAAIGACAASSGDGRDLLPALLLERIPDRARSRSAGAVTHREKPALAHGAAKADPQETSFAPPVAPRPDHADPYRVVGPRRSRSRRILPLALLGAAMALMAGLAVGGAAHMSGSRDADPPASRAAPPMMTPMGRQPSSEPHASTPASVPRELPAAASRDAPPPAAAPQHSARTTGDRPATGPERLAPPRPRTLPKPARDTTSSEGIRVIDLRGSSWN